MMYAYNKPPTSISINGNTYPINYDFRAWIEVLDLIDKIDFDYLAEEDVDKTEELEAVFKIETIVFGGLLDEDIYDVLRQVTKFGAGFPDESEGSSQQQNKRRVLDFKIDMNSLLIAIRNQSGIDLIGSDDLFHWWLFLLEVKNLCGDHRICKLMELRAYEGKDKDMVRAREAVALPPKRTFAEERLEKEMAEIFYNC